MTELQVVPLARPLGYAIGTLLILLIALQRASKDRVLFCQFVAFGAFVILLLLNRSGRPPDWLEYALAANTVLFAVLAGYFGFLNFLRGWLERRKEARQR